MEALAARIDDGKQVPMLIHKPPEYSPGFSLGEGVRLDNNELPEQHVVVATTESPIVKVSEANVGARAVPLPSKPILGWPKVALVAGMSAVG
ncbi:MAG: hypothetical protein NT154_15145 [Verrucomicrobia bacterium]|nr:hypothetical protein [Verrucomicrobiota bacterium]